MALPTIRSYGQYSSDNYGAHTLVVSIGDLDVYFSYKTPVAFQLPGVGRVVHQNDWRVNMGKHLNWIDGADRKTKEGRAILAKRVDATEFKRLWDEHVAPLVDAGRFPGNTTL